MRRGILLLQPKHVSFQWLLEMYVVHIMSQILWPQGVPHTRTGSRETSVAETVVSFQTRTKAEGGQCRHGLLDPHESAPKRHLDRFNRFCTAYQCHQHTDTHTDTQTTLRHATSGAIGRMHAMRPNNEQCTLTYMDDG